MIKALNVSCSLISCELSLFIV